MSKNFEGQTIADKLNNIFNLCETENLPGYQVKSTKEYTQKVKSNSLERYNSSERINPRLYKFNDTHKNSYKLPVLYEVQSKASLVR